MSTDLMNPNVVMSIKSLEMRAKMIVDGFRTGLNKSPRHGFSVEFSEYRPYAQGDDPRFLDWKLFARTDRSYIRCSKTKPIFAVTSCSTSVDPCRSAPAATPNTITLEPLPRRCHGC